MKIWFVGIFAQTATLHLSITVFALHCYGHDQCVTVATLQICLTLVANMVVAMITLTEILRVILLVWRAWGEYWRIDSAESQCGGLLEVRHGLQLRGPPLEHGLAVDQGLRPP